MIIKSRLFRPLDYLRIEHPQKKKFDIIIPLILSIISTGLFAILPQPIKLFSDCGLIFFVTDLLKILSGFYIASLAAVATFNGPGMEQNIAGKPIILEKIYKGKKTKEELTRRKFLCLLFGYLSFMSIFLYFLGAGSILLKENIKIVFPNIVNDYLKYLFIFCYSILVYNLLITTMHGLYYLVDRIHRIDPYIHNEDTKPPEKHDN